MTIQDFRKLLSLQCHYQSHPQGQHTEAIIQKGLRVYLKLVAEPGHVWISHMVLVLKSWSGMDSSWAWHHRQGQKGQLLKVQPQLQWEPQDLKGSWREAEAWHHVLGLEYLKRPERPLVKVHICTGDPNILEAPGQWDNDQGQWQVWCGEGLSLWVLWMAKSMRWSCLSPWSWQ